LSQFPSRFFACRAPVLGGRSRPELRITFCFFRSFPPPGQPTPGEIFPCLSPPVCVAVFVIIAFLSSSEKPLTLFFFPFTKWPTPGHVRSMFTDASAFLFYRLVRGPVACMYLSSRLENFSSASSLICSVLLHLSQSEEDAFISDDLFHLCSFLWCFL